MLGGDGKEAAGAADPLGPIKNRVGRAYCGPEGQDREGQTQEKERLGEEARACRLNYSRDLVRELSERTGKRLTFNNLNVAERYIKGELDVRAVLLFERDLIKGQLHAVFDRLEKASGHDVNLRTHVHSDASGLAPKDNLYYPAMFVFDVSVVERPEQVIPSGVRLYFPDKVNPIEPELLYFSLCSSAFEYFEAPHDGKIDRLGIRRRIVSADDGPSQRVKGRAQVVNRTARRVGSIIGKLPDVKLQNLVTATRVELFDDDVRISLPKFADCQISVADVLIGPFNL